MTSTFLVLLLFLGSVKAFLDDGFDPNAINGFGTGSFNPNAGYSTIAPPSVGGGGNTGGGSGFNPNAGLATTVAPPKPNGFTGWSGSGNFDPNSGNNVATTSSPNGGGGFGNWNWGNGGAGTRKAGTTNSGSGTFGNNWGFGGGSGGFNPNAGFSTWGPPTTHPTTTRTTTAAPTTPPTIHPTTITASPLVFGGGKTTALFYVGKNNQKKIKSKRLLARSAKILRVVRAAKLFPAVGQFDFRNSIVG